MKNLLLYTNPSEPMTRVLLKHQQDLEITPLYVKDLLDNGCIFDEVVDGCSRIEWSCPGIKKITNDDTFLINRVFYLPESWFESFEAEDRQYAQNEFWAYLVFAIDAFKNKTEGPGVGSLTGSCYALPMQWGKIKKKCIHCETPEFYLGFPHQLPPHWKNDSLIYSKVFNFYFWRETTFNNSDKSVFVIKKSRGRPFLCWMINQKAIFYSLDNMPLELDMEMQMRLTGLAQQIMNAFEYFAAEILFFVDGTKITFGMCYNYPHAAQYIPEFDDYVVAQMKTHLLMQGRSLESIKMKR